MYDPYWWEHGHAGQQTTVRRGDGPYSRNPYSSNIRRPNNGGRRRQTNNIRPHPNHNYNPQQQVHPKPSRPSPYRTHQYFSSNYNPYNNIHTSPVSHTRRKDPQRYNNGGYYSRPQVKLIDY